MSNKFAKALSRTLQSQINASKVSVHPSIRKHMAYEGLREENKLAISDNKTRAQRAKRWIVSCKPSNIK